MVPYIDAHCHIDSYEDVKSRVDRAVEKGVKIMINNGINPEKNRQTLELAEQYPQVKAALGLSPFDAVEMAESEIDSEIDFIRENKDKIIAIGEVGMDLKILEEKDKQEKVFRKFVRLAKELSVPVIVHSRKAEGRCIEILEEEGAEKVIMHCFTGKKKYYKVIEDKGWFFTVPTLVEYAEQFQNMIRQVSISKLLCETDSPYLHPEKKDYNEPANVVYSYRKVAQIKGMEEAEVINNIFMNYQRLF
ncbi:MAG: TatD family hydrolase [Nanobdellota archaeon]